MVEKSRASVQYNDALGTVAIDWQDCGIDFWFEELGGNMETHFPIAINVYWEMGPSIAVYGIRREEVFREYENVSDYIRSHEGRPIPVDVVQGDTTLEELFKSMKRCNMLLNHRTCAEISPIWQSR